MKLAYTAAIAAFALLTGSAASATNVHYRIIGDGNVACINSVGQGVYISAQIRGDYNRLCATAISRANNLVDMTGSFSDVDVLTRGGATAATRIHGDYVTLRGTLRGAGSTAATEIYRSGAGVTYDVDGDDTHIHVVIR